MSESGYWACHANPENGPTFISAALQCGSKECALVKHERTDRIPAVGLGERRQRGKRSIWCDPKHCASPTPAQRGHSVEISVRPKSQPCPHADGSGEVVYNRDGKGLALSQ